MKAMMMIATTLGLVCGNAYASNSDFEQYFNQNATAEKLGLPIENEGVKTTVTLLGCQELTVEEDSVDPTSYGICNFWAEGFMIYGVYSTIVTPTGYGFSEAVEVGNFLP